jgi:hypothetical protein
MYYQRLQNPEKSSDIYVQDIGHNLTVYVPIAIYCSFDVLYKRLQNIEKSSDIYVQDIGHNLTVYL